MSEIKSSLAVHPRGLGIERKDARGKTKESPPSCPETVPALDMPERCEGAKFIAHVPPPSYPSKTALP